MEDLPTHTIHKIDSEVCRVILAMLGSGKSENIGVKMLVNDIFS